MTFGPHAPTISVIIPCYNAESYLDETLRSALAQTRAPLEVLVIDDGSTDRSAEIAHAFGDPVRVISQPNQGESVARNRGLEMARGDWVAFLDADDLWDPRKLERQLEAAASTTVAVHTNYYCFGDKEESRDSSAVPPEVRYTLEYVAEYNPIFISSLLVRREASPRFVDWTRYGEDLAYQLDLVRQGEVRLIAEPLAGYRVHCRSQSKTNPLVVAQWLATVERWLSLRQIESDVAEPIRQLWIRRTVKAAEHAYWRRDWSTFGSLKERLAAYELDPEAAAVLSRRVYPPALYRVKDAIDGLLGRRVRCGHGS